MNEQDPIMTELAGLRELFTDAQNVLRSGVMPDIVGLDRRVQSVCQLVQTAAPDNLQGYVAEMSLLVEMLGEYEAEMRALQAEMMRTTLPSNEENDHG